MEVTATYSDESTEKVTNYSIINGESLQVGQTIVTISYTENGITKEVTQTIKVNHDYEEEVIASTCTEDGYTEHKCTRCNNTYRDNETEKLGHDYKVEHTNLPTCEEKGLDTYTCTRCGDTYTKEVAALGHDYKETVVAPTCTENGYTEHKCTRCDNTYRDNETEKLGHDYKVEHTNLPTCEEKGLDTYTCTRCGDTYTKEVAALGHNYKETVVEPTCTEDGYTEHTCTKCNDTYIDNEIAALGHNYENGKCIRCGNEEPIVKVESDDYVVDDVNNYIKGISPKTTVKDLKVSISTNATEVKVFKGEKELTESDKIGTNVKIHLKNEYEEQIYTLVVTGDIDGDGEANFWDMLALNKHRLRIELLGKVEEIAGDINEDKVVDFWDMLEINEFRLGIKEKL